VYAAKGFDPRNAVFRKIQSYHPATWDRVQRLKAYLKYWKTIDRKRIPYFAIREDEANAEE